MNEIPSATKGGQRANQYLSGSDYTQPQTIKHRQLILEQIAVRWHSRGFYRTPTRALLALLEGV